MERNERIVEAARKQYPNSVVHQKVFIKGAEWADKNHWIVAKDEKPKEGELVIAIVEAKQKDEKTFDIGIINLRFIGGKFVGFNNNSGFHDKECNVLLWMTPPDPKFDLLKEVTNN